METIASTTWQKSKVIVKGVIIGFLVLLLLIPSFFVQELIKEREQRQKEAFVEVSSKWAGAQILTGPIVVLPFWKTLVDPNGKQSTSRHLAYFLPDDLRINSTVIPTEKHRGIYKVMLYNSRSAVTGTFAGIDPATLHIAPADVIWNEAYVQMNISDVKGLNEELKINWAGKILNLSPQTTDNRGGMVATLGITAPEQLSNISFSINVDLNGSEQLLFTPVGKSTTVNLNSKWPHPSFTGNILPQTTQIRDTGFTASWKSLSHKRSFPQQWEDDSYTIMSQQVVAQGTNYITTAAFGADLFIPLNGYQKTMRSVKYAILCIILTFTAFFLIETTNRKSVHPLQYALIGFALLLFYTLLLSFSEYIGFNLAYAIAGIATVGLITWFVKGLLGSMKLTLLLTVVLVLLYSYVFTILQLQDYALIMGSLGLFLALAVVMHFSKKIQW